MSNTSTMYLSSVTVVDHAFINQEGKVQGGSYNPTFVVSGSVDPVENVVVDFSTVKKDIKKIIDDRETGFDHKLWIINSGTDERFSDCFVFENAPGRVKVMSSSVELDVPANAICFIPLEGRTLEQYWSDYMTEKLGAVHPGVNIKVTVKLETTMTGLDNECEDFMFTYVHGLRDSTSWGCQNNSHGHLSYMQLLDENMRTHAQKKAEYCNLMRRMCDEFDGSVFIRRENVTLDTDEVVTCVYTSTDRGTWRAAYNKRNLKTIVLDTETTIEHLVAHIAQSFKTELTSTGGRYLAVSEGLTKGALFDLNDL